MRTTLRSIWSNTFGAHIAIAVMCALVMVVAPAVAQDDDYAAGVIIDYGDDRITWIWIPFDEPETPLINLLNDTELEMVTVGFGGLGQGVCQIDDTGCPAADCRQRMCQTSSSSPFWRVMKLHDDEWGMISSGVSGTKVDDGEIYALSWSAETPELPVVSMAEMATNAGADIEANDPVAAIHTDGESAEEDASPANWTTAAGASVLIVTIAGVLVFRAKVGKGGAS